MDAGPVLRQEERPLSGDEQAPELLLELFERGTELLVDALPSVWDGSSSAAATAQDGAAATPAPKVDLTELISPRRDRGARRAQPRARLRGPADAVPLRIGDGDAVRAKLGDRVGDRRPPPPPATSPSPPTAALELSCGDGSRSSARAHAARQEARRPQGLLERAQRPRRRVGRGVSREPVAVGLFGRCGARGGESAR